MPQSAERVEVQCAALRWIVFGGIFSVTMSTVPVCDKPGCNMWAVARSQAPDAPLAASAARYELVGPGGGEAGPGLQQPAGGGAVEGLLAAGAEVVEAAGPGARGPLSLGVVLRRRAAAPAAAQRLVLLQVAGGLRAETHRSVKIQRDDTELNDANLFQGEVFSVWERSCKH